MITHTDHFLEPDDLVVIKNGKGPERIVIRMGLTDNIFMDREDLTKLESAIEMFRKEEKLVTSKGK